MRALSDLTWPVLLVCACLAFDTIEGSRRQDALQTFQPLKASAARGAKQQRKLIGGGSELFLSLQSELVLTQEPYVEHTIDEESNVQARLSAPTINAECAQLVNSRTDLLVQLAGLTLRNCVAKIDDEMFARIYGASSDAGSREQYAKVSLLSSFRNVNIFVEPDAIRAEIEEKLNNGASAEGMVVTAEHAAALKSAFQECLEQARTLMRESMQTGVSQADVSCVN